MKLVTVLGLLSAIIISNIASAQVYVSPEGKDSNPGTSQQPVASLTAAKNPGSKHHKHG